MQIFFLMPAALIWIVYAVAWMLGAPWWIDYPLFGGACVATGVGAFVVALTGGR